jgi:hypothetical protein
VQPGLLRDNRSLGFTCAACHTSQLTYRGTSMLIDGGPTMADMDSLIVAIKDAVVNTAASSEKFDRFADKVLGTDSSRSKRELLRKELNPDQAGDALLECMFRTANGRLTAAEALGHREFVLTRLFESA